MTSKLKSILHFKHDRDRHPFNGVWCLYRENKWVGWHQQDKTILDFDEEIHYVAAVASAGPQANHFPLILDRSPHHLITQFFTHRMFFLMLNQQHQSTDSDRVAVLCPTRHKMGHFGGVPQVNLLACYGKTRPNTRKAYIHQSKEMYNTK